MFGVIDRYFAREIFHMLVGVTIVLLVIFLGNQLVRYLAAAAAGNLPGSVILMLLALKGIKYAILIVPLSLYLSILLVLGRMYRDNEMAALQACGVGTVRLYRSALLIGVPLAAVLGYLSLYVVPWTNGMETRIVQTARHNLSVLAISPGRFRESQQGDRVIYVEDVSDDGSQMHNVFIQLRHHGQIILVSAEKAELQRDPQTGNRYLVLLNGYRYDGVPGSADYKMVQFARHGVLIQAGGPPTREVRRSAMPTAQLWRSSLPADAGELQWRFAVPIATVVLTLLALPIGRVSPRKGMYGKLLVGVFVYIVYFNLIALAESWTEHGILAPQLGLWWVHGLVLLLTLILLARQNGLAWILTRLRGHGKSGPDEAEAA